MKNIHLSEKNSAGNTIHVIILQNHKINMYVSKKIKIQSCVHKYDDHDSCMGSFLWKTTIYEAHASRPLPTTTYRAIYRKIVSKSNPFWVAFFLF